MGQEPEKSSPSKGLKDSKRFTRERQGFWLKAIFRPIKGHCEIKRTEVGGKNVLSNRQGIRDPGNARKDSPTEEEWWASARGFLAWSGKRRGENPEQG